MDFDWQLQTEALIRMLESGIALRPARFSHRQFLGLVRYISPDYVDGRSLDELARTIASNRDAFAQFLLGIPEEGRIRVFEQFARDMAPFFPVKSKHLLAELSHIDESLELFHVEDSMEKFNRYLKRIDGAILAGRYTLAFHLANRLLEETYRAFLYSRIPTYSASLSDLRQMSASVTRYVIQYFGKHTIPYSERTILLITTVSNVLATTATKLTRSSSSLLIDRAIAIYARNNVKRIVKFLSRMM